MMSLVWSEAGRSVLRCVQRLWRVVRGLLSTLSRGWKWVGEGELISDLNV